MTWRCAENGMVTGGQRPAEILTLLHFSFDKCQVELRTTRQEKDKSGSECDRLALDLERAATQHNKAQVGLEKSQEEVARLQVSSVGIYVDKLSFQFLKRKYLFKSYQVSSSCASAVLQFKYSNSNPHSCRVAASIILMNKKMYVWLQNIFFVSILCKSCIESVLDLYLCLSG